MYFLNPCEAKFVAEQDIIELIASLYYKCPRTKQLIVIPKTFQSDGASIPQIVWSAVGHPFQKYVRPAAILHDFLYRSQIFDKDICDQLFYDAMICSGVPSAKAQTFYLAVKLFGYAPYNDNTNLNQLKIVNELVPQEV